MRHYYKTTKTHCKCNATNFKAYSLKFAFFFLLAILLAVSGLQAQTSATVSGVTITITGTHITPYTAPNPTTNQGCPTSAFTGNGRWTNIATAGTLTYTFSPAVTSVRVSYTNVDGLGAIPHEDIGTFTVNGGGTLTLSNGCGVSISGNVVSGSATAASSPLADAWITATSTQPFTTLTVTNTGGGTGWVQGKPDNFQILVGGCNAGTSVPTLTSVTNFASNIYTIPCGSSTADLSGITASNLPASTSLTWHSGTPATTANKLSSVTALSAGTYYAAFFDATNNCYSGTSGGATTTVTVRTALCTSNPPALSSTVGVQTTGNAATQLSPTGGTSPYAYSAVAGTNPGGATALPAGSSLTVNSSTGAYSYTVPTGTTPGTYYFGIQVCDAATPQQCVTKTYTVTVVAACNAGNVAPVVQ